MAWKTFHSAENIFQFEYPQDWDSEVIENVPSFYDPHAGTGAFQIVTLGTEARDETSISDAFRTYAEGMKFEGWEQKAQYGKVEEYEIIVAELQHAERFWFVMMKKKGPVIVLCIYNSDEVPPNDVAAKLAHMTQSVAIS